MVEITRYESTSDGTFGILTCNGLKLHTIEKPWNNNTPFKSCIPTGRYTLHHFTRANGDEVLALSGKGVTITEKEGGIRYAILIHVGNYERDVVGCIAPGLERRENMVTRSREAMKRLMEVVKEGEELTITFGEAR